MAVYSPPKPQKDTPFVGRLGIVIALGLLVLLLLWSVIRMYGTYREASRLRGEYQAERDDLAVRKEHLAESTAELGTERGREAELRNRYRAVRPGEQLIVVVGDEIPLPPEDKPGFFAKISLWWQGLWGMR